MSSPSTFLIQESLVGHDPVPSKVCDCVGGVTTPPCGVPRVARFPPLNRHPPPVVRSATGALSHIFSNRSILRSLIRRASDFIRCRLDALMHCRDGCVVASGADPGTGRFDDRYPASCSPCWRLMHWRQMTISQPSSVLRSRDTRFAPSALMSRARTTCALVYESVTLRTRWLPSSQELRGVLIVPHRIVVSQRPCPTKVCPRHYSRARVRGLRGQGAHFVHCQGGLDDAVHRPALAASPLHLVMRVGWRIARRPRRGGKQCPSRLRSLP